MEALQEHVCILFFIFFRRVFQLSRGGVLIYNLQGQLGVCQTTKSLLTELRNATKAMLVSTC
jgi:hypothetical protein